MSTASKWAQLPLTFDKLRKKHDKKKALRFKINHRTQQALALQEHATTLEEIKIADALWQEVEEMKRELKAVKHMPSDGVKVEPNGFCAWGERREQ